MRIHKDYLDTIDASRDAQAVINRLNTLAKKGGYVFRGYGKQDELLPNIIRKGKYDDMEDKLLKDFEKYGSSYFHASTPIDFMSYAQHFGLPTRLLDFTYNPFIALSFALYSPKSNGTYSVPEDKDYYYVRYAKLDNNLCAKSIPLKDEVCENQLTKTDSLASKACQYIDSVKELFNPSIDLQNWPLDVIIDSSDNKKQKERKIRRRVILFVDPNQANQRIIMQQGLFMFPYTLNKDEHIRILQDNSDYIKIHKDLRNELIQYLDILGYNTFRLMPDLTSICEAVKRRNVDERTEKSTAFKKKGEAK